MPVISTVQLLVVAGCAAVSALLERQARRAEATDRARALGRRRRSLLPRVARARLDAALVSADVPLDADAAVQVWLLAALAAGCLAAGLEPVVAPAAVGAALVSGPLGLYAARKRSGRRRAMELPIALELVASELRTGGTIFGALDALARGDRPLATEFARVNRRRALGAPLDAALEAWATERADAGVSSAAGALAVAAATGGRAADALDALATSLRDRFEIAAEGRALSAQARLSAIVVGSLPVVYLGASALFDARQVRLLTGTTFGLVCLIVGLAFEALAVVWIRLLLRQDG